MEKTNNFLAVVLVLIAVLLFALVVIQYKDYNSQITGKAFWNAGDSITDGDGSIGVTSMGGGSVAITGVVVGVSEEPHNGTGLKKIGVDINGDGKKDKDILVSGGVSKDFYLEKYPIGSKVRFTNLWRDKDGNYHITSNSNKEHIAVSASAVAIFDQI